MTEDIVARTSEPGTVSSLVDDLRALGVEPGDSLLVHASLSALGWVAGGAPTVVDALREAVTDAGTLMVPTHTPHLCSPGSWENPPVPDAWLDEIRAEMPPFRPESTPSRGIGAVAECFRDYPDVRRSDHPQLSFAARGAGADALVGDHPLDHPLGEESPLAALYDRGGRVLRLGVGHDTNTSLHLAEYRADLDLETVRDEGPVLRNGERAWVEWEALATSTDDFPGAGAAFEREVGLAEGAVGEATATLADQRALVDFAADWFAANR